MGASSAYGLVGEHFVPAITFSIWMIALACALLLTDLRGVIELGPVELVVSAGYRARIPYANVEAVDNSRGPIRIVLRRAVWTLPLLPLPLIGRRHEIAVRVRPDQLPDFLRELEQRLTGIGPSI